ncbi:MAG: YitT family protein [Terrisporobacter sp.]
MNKIFNKNNIIDFIYIIIGSVLNAYALAAILEPSGLATSGFQGLSIILEQVIHIRYTYINYAFTILTLILAYIFLGKSDALKIIVVSVVFPNAVILFDKLQLTFPTNDTMLCTIYFGILSGIGCGMLLRRGYTFGGTDTIGKILKKTLFKYATIGEILMIINGLTIIASYFVLGAEVVLFSIINHFIATKILDYIVYEWGTTLYKVEVITPKYKEVRDYILGLGRGVTLYEVTGGYTGEARINLSSTISPKQLVLVKSKIAEIDPNAFVEITHIISVYSKGGSRFQNISECKIK